MNANDINDPRGQFAEPGGPATYATVAAAIRFVAARRAQQPTLAEIADHVGLSPFHLQRVFTAWAGVSPKRFMQYLTKEHAKSALRRAHDVLDAALDSGLSGPGRLHDLLVACDAVSPGEVRRGGAGMEIRYGVGPTPFGEALVATTARGICHLRFADDGAAAALDALQADWQAARLVPDAALAQRTLATVFRDFAFAGGDAGPGAPPGRPLSLHLRGTNFQIKVWEALLNLPLGKVTTYGALAARIGCPGAARAVGSAVGANPVAYLIPCHRVIRESGELGGYRWGLERKQALLAREAALGEREGGGLDGGVLMRGQ